MKKISIVLSVFVVLVLSVLGARYGMLKSDLPGNNKPDTSSVVATTTDSLGSEPSTEVKTLDSILHSAAIKIVDKPITFKADLSEQSRQLATQKIKEASDMIRANYDYTDPWYDLGAYRKLIGDYAGAADAWLFIGKIRPDDYISLHNLGDLYYSLKDYPKAEEYFSASIAKNPRNVDAYIQLSAIYEFNDLTKTSLIEPLLLRGIAANPKESNLMIALGKYYQSKGNLTGARTYFEQALVLNPKNTALEQELQLLGK